MKTKILMAILVSLLVILVVSPEIPAGNKAAERGQGTGVKDAKRPPEIEMGMFVNRPYSSPPWYPSDEETRHYRWYKRVHWVSDDLPLDCVVYTKEVPEVPGEAFAAVEPAFAEWDGRTSTSIYGSISENVQDSPPSPAWQDENTLSWQGIDGAGGIIAVTYFWYWRDSRELVAFDVVFDIDEVWLTSFDIQNVATHELGHTLVLDDLISPKTSALTMHAYTWPGDTWKQTLGWGDILGIQKIYGE